MKVLKIVLILCLSINLVGCFGYMKRKAARVTSEESGAIPPNFGKDQSFVLLCVLEGRASYDKYVKKNTIAEYHGKYEFVEKSKIDKPPYNDKNKYPFVFDCSIKEEQYEVYDSKGRSRQRYMTTYRHFVLDRSEDKKYFIQSGSSAFGLQIKAYMANLEKKRLSYSKK
jgi:hypothetical protein